MASLKAEVLDLIQRDRYRPTGHFLEQCRAREATVEDAIRVLKTGTEDPARGSVHPRFGECHLFTGLDTKDKRRGVVVNVDRRNLRLILVTIYLPANDGRTHDRNRVLGRRLPGQAGGFPGVQGRWSFRPGRCLWPPSQGDCSARSGKAATANWRRGRVSARSGGVEPERGGPQAGHHPPYVDQLGGSGAKADQGAIHLAPGNSRFFCGEHLS